MFKINGNHLAFIGVTGAGLALVAYVLFGPSNKPKSTRKSQFYFNKIDCDQLYQNDVHNDFSSMIILDEKCTFLLILINS